MDWTEDERLVLANGLSPFRVDLTAQLLCDSCGKTPVHPSAPYPPGAPGCVVCIPSVDKHQKCYNCDECVQTREYLKETNDAFTLYGYHGRDNAECWLCTRCNHLICFDFMQPSLIRDIIHEKMRKAHTCRMCDMYMSGELSH